MPENLTDNSFLTERARDYASLADLAYAKWSYVENEWLPDAEYSSLWNDMYKKGYRVIDHKPNDSTTGYSGTLFEFNGQKILANRGTDGLNDATANGQLTTHETPSEQFRSMVEYFNELRSGDTPKLNGQFDVTGHSLGGVWRKWPQSPFRSK